MTPLRFAFLLAVAALALPAQAQLRLPSLPAVPSLPSLPAPAQATSALRRDLAAVEERVQARRQRVADMLNRRGALIEADPAGEPAVRGELLVTSPSPALMAAAQAEGFGVVRERRLEALDLVIVTLRAPAGWDTPRALRRLREIDPQAAIDFNHLYLESGTVETPRPASAPAAGPAPSGTAGPRLGLVDGGIETDHPLLRGAAVRAWGCGGRKIASAHGTAVASLMVGRSDRFRGAAPSATLYAADVYCDDPIGGSIEAVAAALAWLLGEQVPVINISLVGPANRTLEQVVRRVTSRGVLLVAAVGNDGPAAAPLYPAAYPEVVAVTGVDARGVVLPEAGRGPHVAFAAPGSDMIAAGLSNGPYATPRGTSFAAPLVAGRLAQLMRGTDADASGLALTALAREAIDLGARGRDPVYGHGLVARELRVDPTVVGLR
ncbi:MAG TPA: S8 family serine peptidase [Albitalea sp.]|uniref:S8 family serine peptidase n=1 Tax=Piscinibacter sp. TaxID=1903157 RepID=UPI002ED27CF9